MEGKVIIIAVGSEGIGLGMATSLARKGVKVVIAIRRKAKRP